MLRRTAEALESAGVRWVVGASLMLYLRGVLDTFRDIDLFVNEKDFAKAAEALGGFCEVRPAKQSAVYASAGFACYALNGVEIDLIGGYAIRHAQGVYRWEATASETREVAGVLVPIAPLEDWHAMYKLMPGYEERVKQIERCMG
ncbi:MAG: hypothetical protein RSA65_05300 [Clostridia bacterium]